MCMSVSDTRFALTLSPLRGHSLPRLFWLLSRVADGFATNPKRFSLVDILVAHTLLTLRLLCT